jgi:hypothetical protein
VFSGNDSRASIFVFSANAALQLSPADPDIRNNATFAENMKIDAIESLPENTLQIWVQKILNTLTIDGWAKATVLFVILFVLNFLGYYFAFHTARKRLFFISAIVILILGMASLSFAYTAFAKAEQSNPAIVFANKTEVKSEPNLSSTLAFTLHEGTTTRFVCEMFKGNRIKLIKLTSGDIRSVFNLGAVIYETSFIITVFKN